MTRRDNFSEYVRQFMSHGIDQATAELAAQGVVNSDLGLPKTNEQIAAQERVLAILRSKSSPE